MSDARPNSFRLGPDVGGHFGLYGGRYVAETLMPLLLQLERAYSEAKDDPAFHAELNGLLKHYVGRPNPLYFAEHLTRELSGAKIYFKREDLNHTGAHKINNCLGQILLAKRMGKTRIIAETGAGQHGVATATVAALFGLPCVIYMGEVDIERQKPNVFRMNLLGAEVRAVSSCSRTLKDAMNEALRDWVANVLAAHVDVARQAEQGAGGGRRHPVLAGAGLGDDARLAHALGEQDLTKAVVDLVRAGVVEVLSLEVDLGASQMPREPLGEVEP